MAEDYSRPSPDELLARVKVEEEEKVHGKLKIFLGYAPGVGKTYTMLEAARQRKKETDVVVAYIETHGRAETESLLNGLEIIPRREVEYRGIKLSEMDVDAALARHPKLALVDELAHENAPGSRHVKRYQDIEELLEAGIDVYTTLNVQHIESARDVVAQITGVWIREAVPDDFVDRAAEVEVVDLPPDELLKRLNEGRIYIRGEIARATERFFRKGNLTALRELAMRTAAKHVDEQTVAYMKAHAITGPWQSGERLLVFISARSSGARLVRSARRLAHDLNAEWSALYVESPESVRLSPQEQDRITESLHLAQRLGAKTVTIQGDAVAAAVLGYAADNHITKIIAAKPQTSFFRRLLLGEPVVDQIIRQSEYVDIYIVGGRGEPEQKEKGLTRAVLLGRRLDYLRSLGLVAAASLLGWLAPEFFAPANLIMVYLLCVVVAAFLWGFGPSIFVSILSVLLFDIFFIPPLFTFQIHDTKYLFTFVVLLSVGLSISYLMRRFRQQTEAALRRARQLAALYDLGRDLAISNDLASYVAAITKRARETFGHDVRIFLPDPQTKGALIPYDTAPGIPADESELAAAAWAYQHQRTVGHGTDTLPNAKSRYLPLFTVRGKVGVMALSATDTGDELTIEQERLLEAYVDLASMAIESVTPR